MKRIRQSIPESVVAALAFAIACCVGHGVAAQTPAPPTKLQVSDHPWDGGTAADLTWSLSADDGKIDSYQLLKAVATVGGVPVKPEFSLVEFVKAGTDRYTAGGLHTSIDVHELADVYGSRLDVKSLISTGQTEFVLGYVFSVAAIRSDGTKSELANTASPFTPTIQLFDGSRLWLAIILSTVCGSVVSFILLARGGRELWVRKIAGLQAVDEAIGRATEMGRSILFIPGTQDMNDISTVAGLTILSHVARTAAEYDAKLEVPTSRSLVMTAAREGVQAAFLSAGRPDAYNIESIYYVTDEQFGFCAYVQGWMVREKPAACFYMGMFYAESLIFAETGNLVGAIQIAGTSEPSQLPFFVAACDYTLIGEEFFAASAYLSGEKDQLGSLKGQDVGKLIAGGFVIFGCVLATVVSVTGNEQLARIIEFIRSTMLT